MGLDYWDEERSACSQCQRLIKHPGWQDTVHSLIQPVVPVREKGVIEVQQLQQSGVKVANVDKLAHDFVAAVIRFAVNLAPPAIHIENNADIRVCTRRMEV